MFRISVLGLFLGAIVLHSASALGSYLILIEPEEPVAGVPVVVSVGKYCFNVIENPQGQEYYVEVDGGTIQLDVVGQTHPCIPVVPDLEYLPVPLPYLAAGEYTLVASLVPPDTIFPDSGAERFEIGTTTFVVGPGPQIIPVNHPLALAGLAFLLLLATAAVLRRRLV